MKHKGEMMELQEYMRTRKFTQNELAERLGISRTALSNYIHKRRRPRIDIARNIEKFTKGIVSIDDLLNICNS